MSLLKYGQPVFGGAQLGSKSRQVGGAPVHLPRQQVTEHTEWLHHVVLYLHEIPKDVLDRRPVVALTRSSVGS
jgi:hypothetical protein